MNRLRQRLFVLSLEKRAVPATFTVMNLNDSGADSLRQCVLNANAAVGADTIQFKAGLSGFITLISGQILITGTSALTINGPGPLSIFVSGNNANRVFDTTNAAKNTAISFSGLTFTDSVGGAVRGDDQQLSFSNCRVTFNKSAPAVDMTGVGAISATDCTFSGNTLGALTCRGGSVSLTRCTITGNTNGGGVNVRYGGTLNATDCVLSGNTGFFGGAISVDTDSISPNGSATLVRCSITGNSASNGGGLYIEADLLMEGCTVAGNTTTSSYLGRGGGGLRLSNKYDSTAVFTIRNCTISGNSSRRVGGGIYLEPFGTTLNVQNSTITGNTATKGGGIYKYYSFSGTIALNSSIVSGNTATTFAPDVYSANKVTMSSCAVESNVGFTMTDLGGNLPFQPHANLKLGPLANNGGSTLTHTLAITSPCLDKGNNAAGLATDQRGAGFPRSFGAGVDIGAVELSSQVVTNLNDSGPGSLRQAVLNTNAKSGPDTIDFAPGLAGTITLTSGEIAITDPVNIIGPGAGVVTVSGNSASRIFNITGVAAGGLVKLSDLTLTKGQTSGLNFGGAIGGDNQTLEALRCTFSGNFGASGGAIQLLDGGVFTAIDCTFSSNTTSSLGAGGAIGMSGTTNRLVVDGCTFTNNVAPRGGAISAGVNVQITDSTFFGNSATTGEGGAIQAFGTFAAGALRITNSTISGNTAGTGASTTGDGGGIGLRNFYGGTLELFNCTVTGNNAKVSGGGISRDASSTGSIFIESSIVSGNTCAASPDISGSGTVSVKTSAVGSGTGFTLTNLGGNLAFGTNLKLGPLQNNGGPTLTHLPDFDSPLIDVGSNPVTLTTDQRGTGFARVIGAANDIGAVELVNLVVSNANDSGAGSLRQTILHANSHAGPDTITFDSSFFNIPRTISLSTGQLSILEGVTINAPPAPVTVNAQLLSRIFLINPATSGEIVSINGLTLTNGKVTGDSGGGIANVDANLSLNRVAVTNCSASNLGGGIGSFSIHGLALSDCNISGNSSALGGGGIYALSGVLSISNCTVNGNESGGSGGGIYAVGTGAVAASFTLTNSTISGNSTSNAPGGGIGWYFNGTATIRNSTITGNSSGTAKGGGINHTAGTVAVSLDSSIAAGNVTSGTGADLSFNAATNVAGNNNLIGVADSGSFTLTGTGNLTGTKASPLDAKLGPLASNGGPTKTHALLPGSPAIDKGSNPVMLTTDQRGFGFFRLAGSAPDIGAFEVQTAPARIQSVAINAGAQQRSRVTVLSVTFDQVVMLPANPATAFTLRRQSDSALVSLSALVSGQIVTLIFTGGPVDFGSLADGRYTLTALAAQIHGSNFDGNGDGAPGDDFVLASAATPNPPTNIFRLFGDADGDGDADATDFIAFRVALGGNNPTFDFDNDGAVAASDFIQFRLRFGGSI